MKARKGQTEWVFSRSKGIVTGVTWNVDDRVSHTLMRVSRLDMIKLKGDKHSSLPIGIPAYFTQHPSVIEVWPPCPQSGRLLATYQPPEEVI